MTETGPAGWTRDWNVSGQSAGNQVEPATTTTARRAAGQFLFRRPQFEIAGSSFQPAVLLF